MIPVLSARATRCGWRSVVCLGAAVALLASCNNSDRAATRGATPQEGTGVVTIVAKDNSYNVGRLEVKAGAATSIVLENRDTVTHTLTIYLGGPAEKVVAADTGEVAAGERGEALVLFTEAGEHVFRCEVHPDMMSGAIVAR